MNKQEQGQIEIKIYNIIASVPSDADSTDINLATNKIFKIIIDLLNKKGK
jgi:hypothetical protein